MAVRRIFIIACIPAAAACIALTLLYISGLWVPNRPSQTDYPVRGIDVSHHQGNIQWNSVASSGIRFAYMKATEGSDFDDSKFSDNWRASAAAGVTHGAYHFYVIGTSGELQAAHFVAKVPVDPAALPPAVDLELSGANRSVESVAQFQHELAAFLTAVAIHYGKTPVIYTTGDFAKQYLTGMPPGPLWLGEFFTKPSSPAGKSWTLWQYSEKGRVQGIDGFVDMDVFNGNSKTFDEFAEEK
jgi:lysozyme